MATVRRGFEVPYGKIVNENGEPTTAMAEWMDKANQALTLLKTAADGMATLDPSAATASDGANVLEDLRTTLQGIE